MRLRMSSGGSGRCQALRFLMFQDRVSVAVEQWHTTACPESWIHIGSGFSFDLSLDAARKNRESIALFSGLKKATLMCCRIPFAKSTRTRFAAQSRSNTWSDLYCIWLDHASAGAKLAFELFWRQHQPFHDLPAAW